MHARVVFVQVRDLQNSFFNQLTAVAMTVYEKYNQENSDVESLPEDARTLLQVSVMLCCLSQFVSLHAPRATASSL